jgi:hypothetical protein
MSRNLFKRIFDHSRLLLTATAFALFAIGGLSSHAYAQKGGDGILMNEVTWPQTFTLSVGGSANANWQESGEFSVGDGLGYDQSHGLANPNFSIGAEIPMLQNTMFVVRAEYNDYSVLFDQASGGVQTPLVVSLLTIGADAMVKYSFNNFHVMGGGELSTPVNATYAHSSHIEDATHSTADIPDKETYLGALKAGVGYDIPVNSSNSIWLTPEAFYTYPLNSASRQAGNNLKVTALSGGASLKFAIP